MLVFDGNAAAGNLIQEARNGRGESRIYVNVRCRGLAAKASALEGYIRNLDQVVRDGVLSVKASASEA